MSKPSEAATRAIEKVFLRHFGVTLTNDIKDFVKEESAQFIDEEFAPAIEALIKVLNCGKCSDCESTATDALNQLGVLIVEDITDLIKQITFPKDKA